MTIDGGLFDNNQAQDTDLSFGLGGAIRVFGDVNLSNATISNNTAQLGGGAILQDGIHNITNVTFDTNSTIPSAETVGQGGGLYLVAPVPAAISASTPGRGVTGPSVSVQNGLEVNNELHTSELALTPAERMRDTSGDPQNLFAGPTGTITDSSFLNNSTGGIGGGLTAFDGTINIVGSRFVGNVTTGAVGDGGTGGGAFFGEVEVAILDSEFSENSAVNTVDPADPENFDGRRGFGGAINFQAAPPDGTFGPTAFDVSIAQSTFSGNTSDNRSALSYSAITPQGGTAAGAFTATITQSTIVFNDSIDSAVVVQPGSATFDNVSSFEIVNSFLAGNTGLDDDDDNPSTPLVVVPSNFGTTGALAGGSTFGVGETASNTILGTDIVFDFDGDPATPATPAGFATDSPALAPLSFNGGPTRGHLPLAGSNAIDNGFIDNAVDPGPDNEIGTADDVALVFDQRGAPFDRVFGEDVDIGASSVLSLHQLSRPRLSRSTL